MKKVLMLVLISMLLVLSLAGCSQPADPVEVEKPNAPGEEANAPEEEKDIAWPEKPIKMVIGYSAGGSSDTANRMLAKQMSEYLDTEITCVNVDGGSASIAGLQVAKSPADGYTLFGAVAHSVSGWRVLDYADLGWEDFYGFHAGTAPYVLFVNDDSEYDTAEELFAGIKENPNMKWGNAGLGSINQLTGQMMMNLMELEGNSIPYKGGRDAALKVMADEVVFSWAGVSDVMDLAEAGEIKILGVCDSNPLAVKTTDSEYLAPSLVKDYPQLAELEGLLYWGFQIKRDTPPEIISKLEKAFKYAVETEEWKNYCKSMYLEPVELYGEEDDKLCSKLESIYTWGLYDNGLAAQGVSPADFEIPRPEDYTFPPYKRAADANPWP